MGALLLAAPRALGQTVHILQSLSSHLPVSLSGVRDLVLRHSAQHRLPNIVEEGRQLPGNAGQRNRENWCKCFIAGPSRARKKCPRGTSRQGCCENRGHGVGRESKISLEQRFVELGLLSRKI